MFAGGIEESCLHLRLGGLVEVVRGRFERVHDAGVGAVHDVTVLCDQVFDDPLDLGGERGVVDLGARRRRHQHDDVRLVVAAEYLVAQL